MKTMGKMFLLSALLSVGCSTAQPQAGTTESLKLSQLPDVRGCESLPRLNPRVGLKLLTIEGVEDLVVLSAGGRAECIDTVPGVIAALASQGIHLNELASSNPMPGVDPTSDANSNPMPGTDPAASNPMPGTDPSSTGNSSNGKH
jgi:hypothetical protein